MLVLSRKVGESVLMDGGIRVKVLRVGAHGAVRLGFEAPGGLTILREEIVMAEAEAPEISEVLPVTLASIG